MVIGRDASMARQSAGRLVFALAWSITYRHSAFTSIWGDCDIEWVLRIVSQGRPGGYMHVTPAPGTCPVTAAPARAAAGRQPPRDCVREQGEYDAARSDSADRYYHVER